jgi:hypothetical protein
MPELIFSGAACLLHNQRALYIKRVLLFESRVILASVPYRLDLRAGLYGMLSTILPNCSPASIRSCAARASASR